MMVDGTLEERHAWGLEKDHVCHAVTVGMFDLPATLVNVDHETEWLRAAWNLRQRRLEQDAAHVLRFPHQNSFQHSLDGSVVAFIEYVQGTYFDRDENLKREGSHELMNVLVEIQLDKERIIHRRKEIRRLNQKIEERRWPVHYLMARECDPTTPDDELVGIDERIAEQNEAADRDNAPLLAQLEAVTADTMPLNPYAT